MPLPLITPLNPLSLEFENKLITDPYSVLTWLDYISSVTDLITTIKESLSSPTLKGPKRSEALSRQTELSVNRRVLYERAVRLLPGSYKLWRAYLDTLVASYAAESDPTDPSLTPADAGSPWPITFDLVSSTFERSLVRMNKMPRIWLSYLRFLGSSRGRVTQARRAFDGCLRSLPATQHEKVWPGYVEWAGGCGVEETAVRVHRRYAKFDPSHRETFGRYCESKSRWSEAAGMYAACVDDPGFVSPVGTTRHDLWMRLSDVCARHPKETRAVVDFDAVVRAALDRDGKEVRKREPTIPPPTPLPHRPLLLLLLPTPPLGIDRFLTRKRRTRSTLPTPSQYKERFAEIAGVLWCKLAEYYARSGEFGRAREVYEEGVVGVDRVKDFTTVFDGYSRFEEDTLTAKIAMQEEGEGDSDTDSDSDSDGPSQKGVPESLRELLSGGGRTGNDVELSLARAEYLITRRPLLLNAVLLRQNPHNVGEWLRRAEMYMGMDDETGGVGMAAAALEEAVRAVDAGKAVNGFPSELWMRLAKLHEDAGDAQAAMEVYGRVCTGRCYAFKHVEDLADCYCSWSEMCLRQEDWEGAMSAAREGVATPADYGYTGQQRAGGNKMKGGKRQGVLHRSVKLWNLYLDLEER